LANIILFFGWFEFLFTLPTRSGSASNAYDQWTKDGVVEALWGNDIHLGYYPPSNPIDYSLEGFQSAKKVFTEELLKFASLKKDPIDILDIGCGGGTTCFVANKWPKSKVYGVNISPSQVERAKTLSEQHGKSISSRIQFKVANALNLPFENDSFDLVIACECTEHMEDKKKSLFMRHGEYCVLVVC